MQKNHESREVSLAKKPTKRDSSSVFEICIFQFDMVGRDT